MITKGIIKRLNSLEDNHFLVYIPLFKKANSPIESAKIEATAVCLSGVDNCFKVGDVVYVGFEDNQVDKPVILGKLYLGKEDKENIKTTLSVKSIEVTESSNLSANTSFENLNIVDLYNKLNWLMNNNFLPAMKDDDGNFYSDSYSIEYKNTDLNLKNVKETLDYLISKVK
jgi:hypothetical protein